MPDETARRVQDPTRVLTGLVDLERLQHMCDGLSAVSGMGLSVMDPSGAILVASGWQDICLKFHRIHEEALNVCLESDLRSYRPVAKDTEAPAPSAYSCDNGLWVVALPLVIDGAHLANVHAGQFFYVDDQIDVEAFRRRAGELGFDEASYLDALARVPVLSHERVAQTIGVLGDFVGMLAETGLSALRREQERDALQESEERYRQLFEAESDAVFLIDNETGRILEANGAAAAMYGYSRDELLALTNADLSAEPEQTQAVTHGTPVVADRVVTIPLRIHRRKDGSIFPVEITGRFFTQQGRAVHMAAIRDITERKLTEEALRQSEELLRGLFDHMPSGAAIYEVRGDGSKGSDYVVKDFNATSLRLEGKTKEEVVGKSLFDLRPTIDEYGLIPVFQRVWQTGEPALFPSSLYVDEHYTNWYENRVFRLPSGEIVAIYADVSERKRAEEAQRESESRYRELVHAMTSAVVVYEATPDGQDFVIREFNEAAEKIEHVAAASVAGRLVTDAFPGVEAFGLLEVLRKVWATGSPVHFPVALYADERLTGWRENDVYRLPGGDVVAVYEDVGDRVAAQHALAQAKELLERTQAISKVGGWEYDVDAERLAWTDEVYRIHGVDHSFDPNDIDADIGFYSPESGSIVREAFRRAVNDGEAYDVEVELLRADGERIWVRTVGQPVRVNGAVVRVTGTIIDITERARAEQALRLRARIAHILLTHSDDEMYGEVLRVVTEAVRCPFGMFGYLDESGGLVIPSMTRDIWEQCQVHDKSIVFPRDTWGDSSWPRAIREKRIILSNEPSPDVPAGHLAIRRSVSLPIVFQDEVIGLFQVANKETDFTDADIEALSDIAAQIAPLLSARLQRQRAEGEIRRLNADLELRVARRTSELAAANSELESFAYSVSHDLRAPLRALDGFSQILLDDYGRQLDDKGRGYLDRIRAADQRMGELIDALLELSRMSRGELSRERLDVSALARSVAAELAEAEPQHAVEFVVAEGLEAHADRRLTRALLTNLLGNAWKFTARHEAARIEVGTADAGGEGVFFVRDDGAGFDMAYADKLFGAFQRLHSPGEFEGLGIGLATAQRIVRRHGGSVWAESEIEKGATFWFTLPDAGDAAGDAEESAAGGAARGAPRDS